MATTTEKLSFLIEVLTGNAEATLTKFGNTATKALGGADSAVNRVRTGLAGKFTGGIESLTARVPVAGKALDALGLSAESAGAALAGGALVGGAAAVAVGVEKSVTAFANLSEEVLQFERLTGESADASSRFVEVLKELGVDPDQAAISIGRLEKNLGTGAKALSQFGIETVKNQSGRVDMVATIGRIADRMNAMTDPTEKAALGAAAFGRSWQTLLPLLSQGSDGLRELAAAVPAGGVLTEGDVQTGHDLSQTLRDLKADGGALALQLGKDLAPALDDVANLAESVAKGAGDAIYYLDKLGQSVYEFGQRNRDFLKKILHFDPGVLTGATALDQKNKELADSAAKAAAATAAHAESIKKVGDEAKNADNPVSTFFDNITKFARELPTKIATNVLDNAAEGATKLASAEQGLTTAQKDATAAIDDYHRAQKDVVDAQENRQKLLGDEVKANQKVADSIQHVADVQAEAARSAAGAQRDLERAQNAVNRAAEKGDIQGYADAQLGLADAQDRVASTSQSNANNLKEANSAVVDSRQAAVDSAKAYTDSAQTVQDAQKRVQDAIEASAQKAIALAQAVAALDNAQSGGAADASKSIDDQRTALINLEAQYAATYGPDSAPVKGVQHLLDLLNQQQVAMTAAQAVLASGATGGPSSPAWEGRAATDYAPAPGMPGYNPAAGGTSVSGRMFTGALPPAIVQHIYGISPEVAMAEAAARIRPAVSMSNVR